VQSPTDDEICRVDWGVINVGVPAKLIDSSVAGKTVATVATAGIHKKP
jgi:hypothetical protein